MSIYIVTHKKTKFPKIEGYIPIQVGAALHEDLGYLRDDRGDNISEKNPNYCELTALYEIWKNEKKQEIIGMVHYRRFFMKRKMFTNNSDILTFEECKKKLFEYDIILPEKRYFKRTVKEQYTNEHKISDLEKCREIIENEFPEYVQSFDEVLSRKYLHPYNMFVTNRKLFNEYMEWLFKILFQLEKELDISNYDDYNKRIYGFLAERLFNVWILKQNLRISLYPVHNIEEGKGKKIENWIKNFTKKIIADW